VTPRRHAIVGDPVAQSASPRMHAAAFRALGLPHSYEAIRATAEELPGLVAMLRTGELWGLNVTMPHKERILSLVDRVDGRAKAACAANTLVRGADGQVVAHNTDVPAIASELRRLAPHITDWQNVRALVLGTGATARSAVLALADDLRVAHIVVRGRKLTDAGGRSGLEGELRTMLTAVDAHATLALETWAPVSATDARCDVIVQATSCGMSGGPPGEIAASAVGWSHARPRAMGLDVVYSGSAGAPTPFVVAARRAGLSADGGLGVLARQGALAFELWHGIAAPFDAMRAAL
jgi:shikimate dehydrogenase